MAVRAMASRGPASVVRKGRKVSGSERRSGVADRPVELSEGGADGGDGLRFQVVLGVHGVTHAVERGSQLTGEHGVDEGVAVAEASVDAGATDDRSGPLRRRWTSVAVPSPAATTRQRRERGRRCRRASYPRAWRRGWRSDRSLPGASWDPTDGAPPAVGGAGLPTHRRGGEAVGVGDHPLDDVELELVSAGPGDVESCADPVGQAADGDDPGRSGQGAPDEPGVGEPVEPGWEGCSTIELR